MRLDYFGIDGPAMILKLLGLISSEFIIKKRLDCPADVLVVDLWQTNIL